MTEQRVTDFSTGLTKISNTYFPMIERQLTGNGIDMDDYAKECVMNAISAINMTLDKSGVAWNDPQLDQSNITEILLSVASLKLNPSANPSEIYFQTRNVKRKVKGKDEWKKQIEMGIEGDGNDAILARFGRNVKEVRQYWLVREDDYFEYPSFNGLDMQPPKWQPKGKGKVVRVVYPIIRDSDIVEFHIGERHDVIINLIAHVKNNLINETFGLAENRYKATKAQRQDIEMKKSEILSRLEHMELDEALDDEELKKYISPAWKDAQSRESMIIRKMRNNVVKKIPKDFGNTLTAMTYNDTTSDVVEQSRKEINENANKEVIDFEPIEEPKADINPVEDIQFTEEEKKVIDMVEQETREEKERRVVSQNKVQEEQEEEETLEQITLDSFNDEDLPF